MPNIGRMLSVCFLLVGFIFAAFPLASTPAAAAPCGGLNQRACNPLKPGPQCKQWLRKVDRICRPCGGRNQRACPILARGKPCKPGLSRTRGRCIVRTACGAANQRACKFTERVPACNRGLEKRNGRCVTRAAANCGALGQRPCKLVIGRRRCNDGLRVNLTQTKCVRQKYSAKEIGRNCIRQYKPMAPAMGRVAACLITPPVLRVIKPLLDKKNGRLTNRIKKALLGSSCKPQMLALADDAARRGFRSISFGIGAQVGVGAGAVSEVFLAFDTRDVLGGRVHLYESIGYQFGFGLGADIAGVVTAHFKRNGSLDGNGQTFSAGFKAAGGGGISAGIDPRDGRTEASCASLGVNAGIGAAANAGSVGRSKTVKLF